MFKLSINEPIVLNSKIHNSKNDIFKICSQVFGNINENDLCIEELKAGKITSIKKVYLKNDVLNALVFRTFNFDDKLKDQENNETKEEKNEIDYSLFSNKSHELEIMNKISKKKLCEPIYIKYNNGIAYGYSNGVTVNGNLMNTDNFLYEAASKLARFHSIDHTIPNDKFKIHYERVKSEFGSMIKKLAPKMKSEIEKLNNQFPYSEYPSIDLLFEEDEKIMNLLNQIGFGDVKFCHCDLNQRNMIWNDKSKKLMFIDFELCYQNYLTVEIGELFAYFTGHFFVDFDKSFYPNENYRKKFLKIYLEEKYRLNQIEMNSEKFNEELLKLFNQTNLTSLSFINRLITMTPLFDFEPDIFENQESEDLKKGINYYFGRFGLKIYDLYKQIKSDIINKAENYIQKNGSSI